MAESTYLSPGLAQPRTLPVFLKIVHHRDVTHTHTYIPGNQTVHVESVPREAPNKVVLQSFNLLKTLPNGRIVNMLDQSYSQTPWFSVKKTSCECEKSNCKKRYCACYKHGNPCGESCRCVGCQNNSVKEVAMPETKCGCRANQCLSNYCECRKNGIKCSEQCLCKPCKNILQPPRKKK